MYCRLIITILWIIASLIWGKPSYANGFDCAKGMARMAPFDSVAFTAEVRRVVAEAEAGLRSKIKRIQSQRRNQENNIHEDVLACRYCVPSSVYLNLHLMDIPGSDLGVVETSRNIQAGFAHVYLYSHAANLVVDPTYRQYLINLPKAEFEQLPAIFVGSPEEYRQVLRRGLSEEQTQRVLEPLQNP